MGTDDVRSKLWNTAIERASKDLEAVAADQSSIERTVASVDALVAQVSHSVECLFPTNGKESHVVVENEDIRKYLALERELISTALPDPPAVSKNERPEAPATTNSRCNASLLVYDALKAVNSENPQQFLNASKDRCCAELVNELICKGKKRFHCKTWTVSTSIPAGSAESLAGPGEQEKLPAVIATTLEKLVTENLRSRLDDIFQNVKPRDNVAEEKTKVLKEFGDLAKQMAKSCSLDVMEAQYSRQVGEATALYNRRVELLRQLTDQHARLQRVKRTQERRGASIEAVSDHIAETRRVLESRLDECSDIMDATQDLQVMPLDTLPFKFKKFVAEPGCAEDFDKLCKELRGNLPVENRRLEALQNDQRHLDELVADFHRELLRQCQGSIPAWCADQKAAMKGNRNEVIVRELFKEFHRNPDKFVKRMRAFKTRGVPGLRGASVGS
ncbi:uncharacterized protein LOC121045593 [Ixodes scapularis]|uniref:uncharacterized protein LOC121045593 n=1 Tax=Ixodes scapularis TaxID=6945 RepID=UPI001AD76A96|nr:uncharacterized protein LOC121045593 [Ixodes scapularis]